MIQKKTKVTKKVPAHVSQPKVSQRETKNKTNTKVIKQVKQQHADDLCFYCQETTHDAWIRCIECQRWAHDVCAGVGKKNRK